jgi:hypothetical protein
MSGAVARVAASVIATPSARPRFQLPSPIRPSRSFLSGAAQTKIPTTAAKLSCQPTSELERGFRARVATAASSSA